MSAHTPWPWKADEYGVMHWASPGESGGDVEVCIVSLTNPNREADVRLIAAAPDLLAALRSLLDEVEKYHHGGALPAEDTARAAIAKATGDKP